jgi:hypothetical protein
MKRTVAALAAVLMAILLLWWWGWRGRSAGPVPAGRTGEQGIRAFDIEAPAGQVYLDARQSTRFGVRATIRVGPAAGPGMRNLIYEIQVLNIGPGPVRRLSAGALLDEYISHISAAPAREFGTARGDEVDLVPGAVPLGLVVSRTLVIKDPAAMSPAEVSILKTAVWKPIRLKLRWDGGAEYLEIPPELMVHEGLPLD